MIFCRAYVKRGMTVNHLKTIASLGGLACDNNQGNLSD